MRLVKEKIRPGHEHVSVHMIFYIKMNGNFTRKLRLVDEGHTTAPLSSITYSSDVSRESVGVEFILMSLIFLDIFACDICNT